MYLDDLKALKNKLEKKRAELPRNKMQTVLDTVDVPLNIMEIEFMLLQISYLTRRG